MNAINKLVASGSTNGEAGLTMAYQIAEKHMKEGSNNRIIMASDGDLNVGISSASELTRYIEQKRDQGIYLTVLLRPDLPPTRLMPVTAMAGVFWNNIFSDQ